MKKLADYIISALETMADESSSVMALIDTRDDYRIIWANRKLQDFLAGVGVSPVGMRWGGRCPFAFGINALEVLERVVETGEPVRAEELPFGARVSSRFGETTYWNWKILPAMSNSCPGCVLVMADNVTDHVARKAAEQKRNVIFSGVVLDLPVGVATIEPSDFRIIDANDIWLSYLPPQCQTRDVIGSKLDECMPNIEYSGLADILRRVATTHEMFAEHEFEFKDPVRGSIWWNLTVRMMDIGSGTEALLMTVWEVSEQVNARRRVETSRERARAMLQVQQAITASLSLDEVLGMITNFATRLMNSAAASVFLLSDDKKTFIPRGAVGIDLTQSVAEALAAEDSLAARAIRDRRPVTLTEAETPEAESLPLLENGNPVVAAAAASIEAQGEPIGVIEVYNDQRRRFTNDELETLDTLASTAATAILNARLYEEAKRTRDELTARNRALDNERNLLIAIIESIPDAVTVADSAYHLVQANAAARDLYEAKVGETLSLTELVGRIRPTNVDGREMTTDEHPLARAIRGEEFHNFEFSILERNDRLRYRSVSGGSVRDQEGNIIYGVTVGRDITDQKMVQARLEEAYEREKRIAGTLQQALMSKVPDHVDGFQMAEVYEAGLEEAEIGGDFYDVFPVEDGKLVVVIGDVAGKGLSAAIQIAAAKYGIRSYSYQNTSPSHVLSMTNDVLCREQIPGGFVSLFYAVIDVRTRRMTFANAGHELPLLRRKNGRITKLWTDGIVMGVMNGFHYEEQSIDIHPGDKLLLYTDGVTEARPEGGEMLGEDRLVEFWAQTAGDGAETSLRAVYQWAKEFSDGHFHDDVAMLVIVADKGNAK